MADEQRGGVMNNVLRLVAPIIFLPLMFVHTTQAAETVSADLSVSKIYDNNLFLLADNVDPQASIGSSQIDDVINIFGVQLNLDLPLNLQKVTGHIGVVANRFELNEQLDNDAFDLALGWNGELGEMWSGSAKWQRKRSLASFADFQGNQRNIIIRDYAKVGLHRKIGLQWLVWGDLEQDSYSRSLISQQHNDRRTIGMRLGITGRSSAGSELKVIASSRTVDFINLTWMPGLLQDDELREDGLRFRLKWKITGNTTADGGIGVKQVASPHLPQNDFSGNIYDLALAWSGGGALTWRAAVWRDIDTVESAFDNYVVRKGGRFTGQWLARDTLLVRAKMLRQWLDYKGGSTNREDMLDDASLSLVYIPIRNAEFSLTYTETSRNSSVAFGGFSGQRVQVGVSIHWE